MVSLMLALLIGLGIHIWAMSNRDECDSVDKNGRTPKEVYVQSGSRMVIMPCTIWFPRQPLKIQGFWFLDAAVAFVFLISLWSDWVRWRERRR